MMRATCNKKITVNKKKEQPLDHDLAIPLFSGTGLLPENYYLVRSNGVADIPCFITDRHFQN